MKYLKLADGTRVEVCGETQGTPSFSPTTRSFLDVWVSIDTMPFNEFEGILSDPTYTSIMNICIDGIADELVFDGYTILTEIAKKQYQGYEGESGTFVSEMRLYARMEQPTKLEQQAAVNAAALVEVGVEL